MEVSVKSKKLKKALEDERLLIKEFGKDMANKILVRINALLAAKSLADFFPPYSGSERCHQLIGNFEGIFSMDLKQPYRLLFAPIIDNELKVSELLDTHEQWNSIESILIIGIEDTH